MAWSAEQVHNAQVIAAVGRQVGASNRDIQIAIAAAIVESGLRNLDYGDRDSIGMFQQRDAWGSRSQRLDPASSARMFFLGGHSGQRGLLDFGNRNQMSMGQAAQAVQVSAYPDRYAQHMTEAGQLLYSVGGTPSSDGKVVKDDHFTTVTKTLGEVPGMDSLVKSMQPQAPEPPSVLEVNGAGEITADEAGIGEMSFDNATGATQGESPVTGLTFDGSVAAAAQPKVDPMADVKMPSLKDFGIDVPGDGGVPGSGGGGAAGLSGWRKAVVQAAHKMLGTPYVWGGTSYNGVDCSGLIYLIYNHRGFHLPRISADQARAGKRISYADLKPGDLVAVNNSTRNNGADHIGIYVGHGQVIQAPHPGGVVELTPISDGFSGGWGVRL